MMVKSKDTRAISPSSYLIDTRDPAGYWRPTTRRFWVRSRVPIESSLSTCILRLDAIRRTTSSCVLFGRRGSLTGISQPPAVRIRIVPSLFSMSRSSTPRRVEMMGTAAVHWIRCSISHDVGVTLKHDISEAYRTLTHTDRGHKFSEMKASGVTPRELLGLSDFLNFNS